MKSSKNIPKPIQPGVLYYFWHEKEPSLDDLLSEYENMKKVKEIEDIQYLQWVLDNTKQKPNMRDAIIKQIDNFKSKLILYTYDSFLFDVYLPEKEELIRIVKSIFEQNNFPVHGDFIVKS